MPPYTECNMPMRTEMGDYISDSEFNFELTSPDEPISVVLKSITLLVAICAGAVENALVIYVIIKDKKLHRAPYYFMINLAVADEIRSVCCLPFVLSTVMHRSVWLYGSSGCKLLAFASTFLEFGAVFGLFILAVDRQISVTYHHFHARKFQGLMCLAVVLIGWGVSFLLAFPPVFGLGTYRFNRLEAQCTFEHRYYTDNDTLGFTVIFLAMLFFVIFIYVRIFIFMRAHRKMRPIIYQPARSSNWNFFGGGGGNLLQLNNMANLGLARAATNPIGIGHTGRPHVTGRYVSGRSDRNQKLTRVFVCTTVVYVILWLPYIFVSFWYMFDPHRRVPDRLIAVATWMTYMQVALVPLTYVACHKPFRQSFSKAMSSSVSMDYITTDPPPDAMP